MTWGPSRDTIGVEGYEITRQVAGAAGPAPIIATTDGGVMHDTAQSLYAGTQYNFGIIAIDTAGQTSTPQTTTVTTSAFPGTPAPLPPADNSVAAHPFSATRIDIAWAGSPSSDVSGYQVIRDGVALPGGRVDLPGGLRYSDNTVTPGSQHGYAIEAIDSGGNVSVPTIVKPPAGHGHRSRQRNRTARPRPVPVQRDRHVRRWSHGGRTSQPPASSTTASPRPPSTASLTRPRRPSITRSR